MALFNFVVLAQGPWPPACLIIFIQYQLCLKARLQWFPIKISSLVMGNFNQNVKTAIQRLFFGCRGRFAKSGRLPYVITGATSFGVKTGCCIMLPHDDHSTETDVSNRWGGGLKDWCNFTSQPAEVVTPGGVHVGHSSSVLNGTGASVLLLGSPERWQLPTKMLGITVRVDVGSLWILFCIIYCQLMSVSSDDIVVACGGFVKSDVEINYSLIEVSVLASWLTGSPQLAGYQG